MNRFCLLTLFFFAASYQSYAQNLYARVMSGFTAMAGGKTEWLDLDNDNDLDLLSTGSDGSSTLTIVYENVAGVLTKRSTNLPVMSAFASADYDNDGDVDLLTFNKSIPFTKLYQNNGGFEFSEDASFGTFSPSSAIWLDIDNDEDLDFLLVGNISTPRLFENTDAGFLEIIDTNFPDCFNCNSDVADINGDGKVDIVFTGEVTSLYLNAGNKKFGLQPGPGFKQSTLGDVACGDFDGDGDFDILLTGLLDNAAYTAIYENINNHFEERIDLGLIPVIPNSSSGLLWFNANNDGKLDLFLNGSIDRTNVFATQARVFKSNGSSFTDMQDAYLGFDSFTGSYDAGDFDNDGDMDLGFQGTKSELEGVFSPQPVLKRYAGFYRNDLIMKTPVLNTKPLPPGTTAFSEKAYRKEIRLKWGNGSDGETPAAGLFYNFYLRDANKKLIIPNVNFSNGNILTANAPNGTGRSGYAFDMPEGTLYYAVQSIDGAKTGSVFSTEKMFYHFNGPEALTAEFTDQQHVNLSWLDHSALESNFEVLRSTSPTTGFSSIAVLPADRTTYADNFTFATETEYHYRIRGYNAQATVYDSLSLVIPNRPENVAALALNASGIKLTWVDQSQYETAYIIERREGTSSFEIIAILGSDVTQYEDTQLQDGITYEYRVISKGKNGALSPITSASATTNARPVGLNFEVSQDEDRTLVMKSDDFNNNFRDANASDKLVKFKIVSLPENGTLYVYTSQAVIGQEVTPDLFDFIEFKPFNNYTGTTTLNVRPYDGKDYSNTDWTIFLKINQINDPPEFDLPSRLALNEDFILDARITPQRQYFPGEEDQVITYSISPQASDIVEVFFNPTTGEILLAAREHKFGEIEFTLTADDGQMRDNTYSQKVTVSIKAVNDPPVLGLISDVLAESNSVTINLDIQDPDNNLTASMVSAFSSNRFIVKEEKIKFRSTADGVIAMTVVPEAKLGDTYISVIVNDGVVLVTQQFKFSVVLITGIEGDLGENIIVYPNPVSKELKIDTDNGERSLRFVIRDVHGRRFHSGNLDKAEFAIDLSEFAPGIYFLEITKGNKPIAFKKIIKL